MEKTLLNLVEQLMTQLIKLDEVAGDGDVKLKRRLQVSEKKLLWPSGYYLFLVTRQNVESSNLGRANYI